MIGRALLAGVACLLATANAQFQHPSVYAARNGSVPTLSSATAGHVIVDNDPGSTAVAEHLLLLNAGLRILGLTSVIGDTNAVDGASHLVRLLEIANLTTCIPVVQGAQAPLVRTNATIRAWADDWGVIPWLGAYRGGYPTGDAQFPFGQPQPASVAAAQQRTAAEFMVEQVKANPGQVSIYAAGPLTNVALAQRLWPDFASQTKELVAMGGFTDSQRLYSTGDELVADLWSDFNLIFDPEAAQIALTAPFPRITMVGNAANTFVPSSDLFARVNATARQVVGVQSTDEALRARPMADLFVQNQGQGIFPLWDESTAFLLASPAAITDSFQVPATISTASASPFYGKPHLFNPAYLPTESTYRNVTFVNAFNVDAFQSALVDALSVDWSTYCST